MRRILVLVTVIGAIMAMTSSMAFGANGIKKTIDVTMNSANIKISGQQAGIADINYENRVYVPLKAFCELIGKDAVWDASTSTINVIDAPKSQDQAAASFMENLSLRNLIHTLAISFQLAGIIMLAQMVLFRRRNDIAFLARFVAPSGSTSSGAKRLLYETWLTRTGFYYILAGTIISFIKASTVKMELSFYFIVVPILTLVFLLLGWLVCNKNTTRQYPRILKLNRVEE